MVQENEESAVTLTASNVNTAFIRGLTRVYQFGDLIETRNGPARVLPSPLITHYERPQQRVLFLDKRDANPFFHLFESLWMLGGRNDVDFVQRYASNMASYSDDGTTFNGAYGYRWRKQFKVDQIEHIVHILKKDPDSRRVVLQMWDSNLDLVGGMNGSKDVCCNMLVKYRIRHGHLLAYVVCRSNDMLFGGYGANAFHFSFLQEYLADRLGVKIGGYEQISLDAHLYTEGVYGKKLWGSIEPILSSASKGEWIHDLDPYLDIHHLCLYSVSPLLMRASSTFCGETWYKTTSDSLGLPSVSTPKLEHDFDTDLSKVLYSRHDTPLSSLNHPYFSKIVHPLMVAHNMHKNGRTEHAIEFLTEASLDVSKALGLSGWQLDIIRACIEWLERRQLAKAPT